MRRWLFDALCVCNWALPVRLLFRLGLAPAARYTCLHRAVAFDAGRVVAYLLRRGANPNERDRSARTALQYALVRRAVVRDPGLHIIGLLLRYGADPNQRDRDGSTALHYAVALYTHWLDLYPLAILLHYGADPDRRNYDRYTPLHRMVAFHILAIREKEAQGFGRG